MKQQIVVNEETLFFSEKKSQVSVLTLDGTGKPVYFFQLNITRTLTFSAASLMNCFAPSDQIAGTVNTQYISFIYKSPARLLLLSSNKS